MKDPLAVYKLFSFVLGEQLAVYFGQYGQILGATNDNLNEGWSFNIVLDC